jgi:putative redox protein
MDMRIYFPGGKRVDAQYKGLTIQTDQSVMNGGEGKSPAPFDLFLASIGTCAGIYVLSFCQERNIPTQNIDLVMKTKSGNESGMIEKIAIDINLPDGFPEKYNKAVRQAADLCAVKKNITNAPEFEINIKHKIANRTL